MVKKEGDEWALFTATLYTINISIIFHHIVFRSFKNLNSYIFERSKFQKKKILFVIKREKMTYLNLKIWK